MKILVLVGSHRRNGNTDQITGLIKTHLQAEAARRNTPLELETVYLGQQNLQFCRGCRLCYNRGEEHCPVRDDLLGVKAKMRAADGILLASPVYVNEVSATVKNLIDRLSHVCHRPEFGGKAAYLVATTASSPTRKTLATMKLTLRTWGYSIAGQSGFKMGALMKREETQARFDTRAAEAAHCLFEAVGQRRPGFYALMAFKIQQRSWQAKGQPGTPDYDYWQRNGWFDPKATFYISHDANPLKVALARLAGAVLARFVT